MWNLDDIAREFASSPCIASYGLEVVVCDPAKGLLTIRCAFQSSFERLPGSGQWHGGPIAAIIDTVGDFAAAAKLERALPTSNLRIDYVRPASDTALLFSARVRRAGRLISLVDVEVTDEASRLVAVGRGTYVTAEAG